VPQISWYKPMIYGAIFLKCKPFAKRNTGDIRSCLHGMVSGCDGAREGACGNGFVRSNSALAGVWTRGLELFRNHHMPALCPGGVRPVRS